MHFFLVKHYLQFLVVCLPGIFVAIIASADHNDPEAAHSAEHRLSREMLTTLVRVDSGVTQSEIDRQHATLSAFVEKLRHKQRRYRSEERFLSYFFYKVHRQFLKRYRPHTTLYELLEDGRYDCVTGSALYALLLDALGISYQVHEFPYHVYLTVVTTNGDTLMLESTDPQNGFVTNLAEQTKRQEFYSQVPEATDSDAEYQYNFTIREQIGLSELAGLSYFNEAVEHYNRREFQRAHNLLRRANRLYASPRVDAFKTLISGLAHQQK